jgi:hypothetical protein
MREGDLQLLITMDDPWNARECDAFDNRQAARNVAYRPGRPHPTSVRHGHRAAEIIGDDSHEATSNTPAGKEHHLELF